MQIHPETVKEWRNWLKKNHLKEEKVYLISWKKHTKKPSFSHNEAMREAICFGWIDTTMKRLDEDRYQRCFVKRKPTATWSNNTLRYAEEEIAKGKMSKYGMKMYELGKLKPTLDHGLPKDMPPQKELIEALKKHKLLLRFNNLAPSIRRYHIWYLERAKQQKTKEKRIQQIIDMLNT